MNVISASVRLTTIHNVKTSMNVIIEMEDVQTYALITEVASNVNVLLDIKLEIHSKYLDELTSRNFFTLHGIDIQIFHLATLRVICLASVGVRNKFWKFSC